MLWIRFGFLSSLVLFNSVLAVVTLKVRSNAVLGTPLDVVWKRDRGDPRVFDLHKFLDGEDYGFIAHVEVNRGQTTGHITVNFDETGDFTIRAFDFEESQQPLAETPNHINVRPFGEAPNSSDPADPASTSEGMSSTNLPPTASSSTATAPSSSSSSTGPTTSPSQTPSSVNSKPPPKINAAAIAGGVIGGIVVFALLALGIILLIRRRRASKESTKRFTFHRDLMVQARPTAVSHSTLSSGERSPRLPRFSFQRRREPAAPSAAPLAHSFHPAHAGPTDRQLQLNARVRQLEEMMHEIRYRPGMSRVLEQLRSQVSWLRAQRNSPWALHETDERPQHYDLYMTS